MFKWIERKLHQKALEVNAKEFEELLQRREHLKDVYENIIDNINSLTSTKERGRDVLSAAAIERLDATMDNFVWVKISTEALLRNTYAALEALRVEKALLDLHSALLKND